MKVGIGYSDLSPSENGLNTFSKAVSKPRAPASQTSDSVFFYVHVTAQCDKFPHNKTN